MQEFKLKKTIKQVLKKKFAINDYEKLRKKLEDAKSILLFTDNAGEIGLRALTY